MWIFLAGHATVTGSTNPTRTRLTDGHTNPSTIGRSSSSQRPGTGGKWFIQPVSKICRMTECAVCGDTEDIIHDCAYCGETFCDTHQIPEAHECPAVSIADTPGVDLRNTDTDESDHTSSDSTGTTDLPAGGRATRSDTVSAPPQQSEGEHQANDETPEPVSIDRPGPGTPPEPDKPTSPDLNPDGSLATDSAVQHQPSSASSGFLQRVPWQAAKLLTYYILLGAAGIVAFSLVFGTGIQPVDSFSEMLYNSVVALF